MYNICVCVCVCSYKLKDICYVIDAYLVHVAVVRNGAAKRSRVDADLYIYLSIYVCVCVYVT